MVKLFNTIDGVAQVILAEPAVFIIVKLGVGGMGLMVITVLVAQPPAATMLAV